MNLFSEDNLVEKTVIKLIKEIWADSACHVIAYTNEEDAKLSREHRGDVVLKKYLLPALEKLNPQLPQEAIEQAVEQIIRDRSHLSLVNANKEIYQLLGDDASMQVINRDGSFQY